MLRAESGESDWTFFFSIALSSEGVEDTEYPTPERKLELFSSIDELGSYLLPAAASAKTSSCFLFAGFVVIEDFVLILWMIDEFS